MLPKWILHGAVAQLGERMNGIHEVEGSIPFGSTIRPGDFEVRAKSIGKHDAMDLAGIWKPAPVGVAAD